MATKKATKQKKTIKKVVKKAKRKATPTFNVGDLVMVKDGRGSDYAEMMTKMGIPARVIEKNSHTRNYTVSYGMIAGENCEASVYGLTPSSIEKAKVTEYNLGDFMDWGCASIETDYETTWDEDKEEHIDTKKTFLSIGCNEFSKDDVKGFNNVVRSILLRTGNHENLFNAAVKQAMRISMKAELVLNK